MLKTTRVSGLVVGALIAAALSACAIAANAQESKRESPGVTGEWHGESSAGCAMTSDRTRCRAVNDVTFNMVQRGSKVTGSYMSVDEAAPHRDQMNCKAGHLYSRMTL